MSRSHNVRYDMKRIVESAMLNRLPRLYTFLTSSARYWAYYHLRMVHEPEFRTLRQYTRLKSPLVFDIGANRGQSILSIMRTFPTAQVISFEPNLMNTDALCRVADHFPGRVSVERVALSDIDGEEPLFWPVYNGQPLSTLASFDITAAGSWLADNMPWFDPEKLKVEHVSVVAKRLDSLNLRPDIIKIDVEGSESRVIQGGLATIEACRPIIMAESLDSEALDALRLFKYRAVGSPADMRRARIVVSDVIAMQS